MGSESESKTDDFDQHSSEAHHLVEETESLASKLSNIQSRRVQRVIWWSSLSIFAVMAIYFGARLIWSQQSTRTSLTYNENLEVEFGHTVYGLEDEFAIRLVEVNGQSVRTIDEARRAESASNGRTVDLTFQSEGGGASRRFRVVWHERLVPPKFDVNPGGAVVPLGNADDWSGLIAPGERVVRINGTPIEEIAAGDRAPEEFRRSTVRFDIAGIDEADVRELWIYARDWRVYWARFAVGGLFAFLGFAAFRLRPNSRSSVAFLFFCVCAGMFWITRSLPFHYRLVPENAAYFALQAFLFVPGLAFMAAFSPMRLVIRRPGRIVSAFVLIIFAMVLFNVVWFPDSAKYGLLGGPLLFVYGLMSLALVLSSALIDLPLRLRATDLGTTDRQRAWVIRAAIVLGFAPTAAYVVLRSTTMRGHDYQLLFELTVLLFPLLFAYAIVRHNLLQLNQLVREGVLYSLLGFAILAFYASVTGMLGPLLNEVLPQGAGWIKTGLVGMAVMAVIPLHGRVKRKLDERFDRTPGGYEAFLESLDEPSEDDLSSEDAVQRYCRAVTKKLSRVAFTEHVTILLFYPSRGQWSIGAITPTPKTGCTTEECRPLIDLLERRRGILYRDSVEEELEFKNCRTELLDSMQTLHAAMAIPLRKRERIVGALCVGDKANFKNYSAKEIKALEKLAKQLSMTLDTMIIRAGLVTKSSIADMYPNYPATIGSYTIDGVIGEGGMSYVYRAHKNGESLAIKVANHMVQSNRKLLTRFEREAIAMLRVTHPHIVRIQEVGREGNEPFIVVEYCDGGSLDAHLKARGRLPETEAILVVLQAARGLQAAYQQHIIHRDIKLKNILCDSKGGVKLCDFGLARLVDETTITSEGDIFGTLDYMSPEAIRSERVGWYSDQYSLGIALFELLAGKRPYHTTSIEAALYNCVHAPLPSLTTFRSDVSPQLIEVIERMTAKDPADRYSSYQELIESLEQIHSLLHVAAKG